MNSATTVKNIRRTQDAFKVLSMLQLTAFLWPQQANVPNGASFDYIVVGAGSAGSVIANRLTEIESINVLLIEAGGDPPLESVVPSLFTFLKESNVDWNYTTAEDHYVTHKKRKIEVTRGKMLGGCSSLNYMGYTRGHYKVYDDWARITNDDSWSWVNVLPYFLKSERLLDTNILNSDESIYHNTNGYLGVTKFYNHRAIKYLKAFAELGNKITLDINDYTTLGYTESLFNIAEGVRQSTAYSFLHPIKERRNLFVLKDSLVSRIVFDNKKNAIGVEVILKNGTRVEFKANKEVIVSAGTINSPQLLMLSGIGPKEHLKNMNINIIADLPVGQNLQDHVLVLMNNVLGISKPPKPKDPRVFPVPVIMGHVTLNKTQNYPDYQTLNLLLNEPSEILELCSFYYSYIDEICDALYYGSIGKEVLFSFVVLINPKSRGKILLRSTNPQDDPLIYAGYYSNDQDLANYAKYIEDFMRLHGTKLFKSEGGQLIVPEVCSCGNKIDEKFWKCYAKCLMMSGYHYVGTCSMGSVVDSRLNVYGVKRLRVVDASVMPKIPGSNVNAATIMIGEKAADIIREDYFLTQKKISDKAYHGL